MPGPIIRSGPSEKYTENWGNVFGKSSKSSGTKKSTTKKKKATKKTATKKTTKKKSAKK